MIDMKLSLYCLVLGGTYLLLFTLLHEWLGRRLNLTRNIPPNLLEESGPGLFVVNFIMEALFFVAIPTLGYSFFSIVLPLSGIRPAMAVTLVAFTLGAVPALMGLSMRMWLPMPFLLYHLLGLLLKLGGCIAVVGYLYTL